MYIVAMITLEEAAAVAESRKCRAGEVSLRQAIILLIVFLLVCSDYVINNVISLVPGAVVGREVLSRGVVVQGVLLVLAYALGNYLLEEHVF